MLPLIRRWTIVITLTMAAWILVMRQMRMQDSALARFKKEALSLDKTWEYQFLEGDSQPAWPSESEWKPNATFQQRHNGDWKRTLWLKMKLPAHDFSSPAISIINAAESFAVYDNRKNLVFENRPLGNDLSLTEGGLQWDVFPVPAVSSQDEPFYFQIHSSYNRIGLGVQSLLGENQTLAAIVLGREFGAFVASSGCIGIGVLMFFFWLPNRHLVRTHNRSLLRLSIFALISGFYIFSRIKLAFLLFPSPLFWRFFEFTSLYHLPYFGSICFRSLFDNKSKILRIFEYFFLSFLCLQALRYLIWGIPFKWGITIAQISLLLIILPLGQMTVRYIRSGNSEARTLGFGICSFLGISGLEILRVLGVIPLTTSITHWGAFLFVTSLATIAISRFVQMNRDIESLKSRSEQIHWDGEQKKLNSLAHFALFLGDRVNTPLCVLLNAAEEVEESAQKNGNKTVLIMAQRILKAVYEIRDELRTLDKFKQYAPEEVDLDTLPDAEFPPESQAPISLTRP